MPTVHKQSSREQSKEPGFEPWAAGWEAQMLLLCCVATRPPFPDNNKTLIDVVTVVNSGPIKAQWSSS